MTAPARPFLVPGAHVLRRHDGRLQVGLDPRAAVVLPAGPAAGPVLKGLDGSALPADETGTAVLALLDEAGLLVDERVLMPVLGERDRDRAARVAALVRQHGDRSGTAAEQRTRLALTVTPYGVGGDALAATLTDRLTAAGLPVTASATDEGPTLAVLVGVGEPDRELLDGWMRARVAHLLVRMAEGRALVGPFVEPGRTACLRCVDAHHADADPTWPLLVRQYAGACARPRSDGVPEPLDVLLAGVALAWAARDVATWAEGGRPSLWSTVLTLDAALREVETCTWTRHPECGCSWQDG